MIRIFICFLVLTSSLLAQDNFNWDPVSEEDWEFKIPDSVNVRHAAYLFEKVVVDDKEYRSGVFKYKIYKRIRIFNKDGLKYADVQVPILDFREKIKTIKGRVILNDRTIIELQQDHIYKKEIIKTSDDNIEQYFFYIPGATDDCILEYYIEYELPGLQNYWSFEKDLFLVKGELTWIYYGTYNSNNKIVSVRANYLCPNKSELLKSEHVEVNKGWDKLVFSANNISPYKHERYALGENALKGYIKIYYNHFTNPTQHWVNMTNSVDYIIKEKSKSVEKVDEVVARLNSSLDRNDKIDFLYSWVQDSIKNIDYADDGKNYKANETFDDIIINGFGTSADINWLFYRLLRGAGIHAFPVFSISRKKGEFHHDATYWQFDDMFIGVRDRSNINKYYDPSVLNLPPGYVDWDFEGTASFIASDDAKLVALIPFTGYRDNTITKNTLLKINEDYNVKEEFYAEYTGHFTTLIKDEINYLNKYNYPITDFELNEIGISDVDSILIAESKSNYIKIECDRSPKNLLNAADNFKIFDVSKIINENETLQELEERNYDVLFDYAYTEKQNFEIEFPQNLTVYSLPKDLNVAYRAGDCKISYKIVNEQKIMINYEFKIRTPFVKKDDFSKLKILMDTRKAILSQLIVFDNKN